MCPICIATTALVISKAGTAADLTAVVAKKLKIRSGPKGASRTTNTREGEQNESTKCRIAISLACGSQAAAVQRKGVHATARCPEPRASQAAHGQAGKELHF
jgi:hypothetical protein